MFSYNSNEKKQYINWKYGENHKYNPLLFLSKLFPENYERSPILNIVSDCFNMSISKISFVDVLREPQKQNWAEVSENSEFADILAHPNLPWEWDWISSNPKIKINDILAHPNLPWEWEYVLLNPSITLKEILQYPCLSKYKTKFCFNKFLWDNTVFKTNLKKDIKQKREKIKSLSLFGSLETLIEKYVGYV